jgi:penicillin G amidase
MRPRRIPLAAIALLASLAALQAPAHAETLQAEGVLPPGQSGFVSITGLPSGTGSPHLTDQISLYNNFEYKPLTFDEPGTTETPMAGVSITRDSYGVPAVTGETEYDAWWGVGYAVAQDRLFELELFRRATSGRLAEILGSSYLDDDLIARRDYYTDAEVDAMMAEVPQRLRDRAQAYADGINAWIDHVTASPSDMPGEFVALGDLPIADWTVRDSARVGVFLARTVPSSDGVELDNALALQDIGGRNFKKLLPLRNAGRRVTVPRSEGVYRSQPGRTRRDERIGWRRSKRWINRLDLSSVVNTAESVPTAAREAASAGGPGEGLRRILPSPGGSFMWAIAEPSRSRSFLYNGPQLGFAIPELFVEFEIHSPSLDLRGVSAPGVPLMGIGHNGHVAWGFTSGLSDEDDLFVEKVTGPETYRFQGEERQMECRDEQFTWKPPPTDLPDTLTGLIGGDTGAPAGSTTERICRTIHGPVQYTGDGVALARRYAIWNRELETIVGIDALNEARTVGEVDEAMREVTWNENVIAADDRGNIGYWHPGLHPLRPKRWDERLPFPGTGRAEWRGLLPRSRTPQVINPSQGWLANWNNMPSWGWTNGDSEARERLAGPLHRVRILEGLVAKVARNPGYGRSTRIAETSGTTAQQRPFVSERKLRAAKRHASGAGDGALAAILAWNGDYHSTDDSDTVDPGVATWEEWKAQMQKRLLKPMGPGAESLAGQTGRSHQFDITNGESVALRTLGARAYARAAEKAAAELTDRFGSADPASWREPRRMYEVTAQGAGSSPDIPFFDRGTWNQSIAVGR